MKEISKTNKEVAVYKNTVYAKMRRALYNAVNSNNKLQETQWDENGRCHIVQTYGDRGIIATIQRKANNKGWVVFFSLSMLTKNNSIPFIRDLNIRLTINETPSGVKLLWFINNRPQWLVDSIQMVSRHQFHGTGFVIKEVINQIGNIYSPEDFIPILKYMQNPEPKEYTLYGLDQRWMNKLSGGTNPKQILNTVYGKDGQDGLSKNAFGGINKIHSFATFVITAEIVRYLKSFPSSFFDKIIIKDFGKSDIAYLGMTYRDVTYIQYFIKYFNHSKIQQDFIHAINNFEMSQYPYYDEQSCSDRFFTSGIWQEVCDAGRMLKQINDRAVRRNILAFKGTVEETHDLITVENAKLSRKEKKIKYTKETIALDNQQVTDSIISVLPKTTTDLVLWGSQQHNCIGSYGEIVAGRNGVMIVGFKHKITGAWVGHAELAICGGQVHLDRPNETIWNIRQLKGKYNANLNESEDIAIRAFLKKTMRLK